MGNQWAAAVPPPSDRGAPATPRGGRCARPPPRAASPTQSRATRGGPIQTRPLRAPTPRRFPTETSHACGGRSARAEPPICPRGREGKSGGLTPPPWVPRSRALRRARPPPSDAPPPSVPFPPIDELTLGRKLATLYIWMVTGTPSAQCHVVQPGKRAGTRYHAPSSLISLRKSMNFWASHPTRRSRAQ